MMTIRRTIDVKIVVMISVLGTAIQWFHVRRREFVRGQDIRLVPFSPFSAMESSSATKGIRSYDIDDEDNDDDGDKLS